MSHICYPSYNYTVSGSTPRRMSPLRRFGMAAVVFLSAYLTTVTVKAQENAAPVDTIQLTSGKTAVITGTIKSADENYIIVDSAGKDIRVTLDKVNLRGEADDVFTLGMPVTVEGKMQGTDFDVPIMEAYNVTAQEAAPAR